MALASPADLTAPYEDLPAIVASAAATTTAGAEQLAPWEHATLRRALAPTDPLAHRALESLLAAEAAIRRRLSADLRREGLSAPGFSVLIVLVTAGGELELRSLRRRLQLSKANATEVISRLQARGFIERRRLSSDRRAAAIELTPAGRAIAERLFPQHSGRVSHAFAALDESEKRSLTSLCRKIAA
jgi:MarR family 2-MHQ and catechol resistance regulon transcriptional repressor